MANPLINLYLSSGILSIEVLLSKRIIWNFLRMIHVSEEFLSLDCNYPVKNYVTIITPNNHLLSYQKQSLIYILKSRIFATKFLKYLNHTSLATQMSIQISITKGTCTISFPWGHDDSHHLICNLVALVVFIWTNPSTVGIRAWHGVDHLVVINQPALFRVDIQLFKTLKWWIVQ